LPCEITPNTFSQICCRTCRRHFIPGLLARTVDREETQPEDFSRFHVREAAIGAFYLTETGHPPGYRIPKHSHEMASLYFLIAGSLTEKVRREDVDRKAGELVFTPADVPHSNQFLGQGGHCLIVELHPALHSRLNYTNGLPQTLKSFRGHTAWLTRRLYTEFRFGDAMPLVVEGLILEILGEICRQRPGKFSPRSQRKVSRAREFVDAAFSQPISLDDIARAVDLHPVYVARRFRQAYRCSVGEYLRRRRVDYACSQLAAPDKPLAEIAAEAGFFDQAHFTRTFHKLTGLTPGQYRGAHRR
jgi:AraC family transcriptional regulator